MYKEPTEHNEEGWIPVCGEHVDLEKDGVTVLMGEYSGVADVANAEILTALQNDETGELDAQIS